MARKHRKLIGLCGNKEDAMNNKKYIILGTDDAAMAAVNSIRMIDTDAEIKMVSRETYKPYSTSLLPSYISGELDEEALFFKGQNEIKKLNIDYVVSDKTEILSDSKEVMYKDGTKNQYDKLLITQNNSDRPSIDLEGISVYNLATFEGCKSLKEQLKKNVRLAILGNDELAVQFAAKISQMGVQVTIVTGEKSLLTYFNESMRLRILALLQNKGIKIICETSVERAEKAANGTSLMLKDHESILVDCVATATINTPIDEKNLCSDEYFKTSVDDIYAALSYQDVPEAVVQGKIAGLNMAGEKIKYTTLIKRVSVKVFDEDFFHVGLVHDSYNKPCRTLKDKKDNSIALICCDDQLVCIDAVNQKFIHPGVFSYLIRNHVSIKNYEKLLVEKTRETALYLMNQDRKKQII